MCIESRALDRDSFGYLEHRRVIGRRERGEDRSGRFAMLELPIPNEIRSRRLKERHHGEQNHGPPDSWPLGGELDKPRSRYNGKCRINWYDIPD